MPQKHQVPTKRFFAMNISKNAMNQSLEKRLKWAKAAGFRAQHELNFENMAPVVAAYDENEIHMAAVYQLLNPHSTPDIAAIMSEMQAVASHEPLLLLAIQGATPSGTELDTQVVELVRTWADIAQRYKLRIALYPHAHYYAEKFSDVLRLSSKVDRGNVGVIFNLCHFLMVEGDQDWKEYLKSADEKLFAITLNGADRDGGDWSKLIQPLDRGNFDASELLSYLNTLGFDGPIGLQDYGVKGEPQKTLTRSFERYLQIIEKDQSLKECQ